MTESNYEHANRRVWDAYSDEYQTRHSEELDRAPEAWGVWRVPEASLQALGDLTGADVLEFGCGGAQWAIALARRGVNVVGMDLSGQQLTHAQANTANADVHVPLVQASATATPFASNSFDVVFCDHGAMTFADPYETVPEAARLLRPGGRFVFCLSSPLFLLMLDPVADRPSETMHRDYFGMHRFQWPGDDMVDFQIPYGEWIRLFHANGLDVEDLMEVPAPADASSSYRNAEEAEWARRWPMEDLWRLRKRLAE